MFPLEGGKPHSCNSPDTMIYRRTVICAIAGASLAAVTGGHTGETDTESPPAVGEQPDADSSGPVTGPTQIDVADAAESDVAFELAPFELTECGSTCREVTTTLTNTGSTDATTVHVSVTVSAGETLVWETDEVIGQLAAGAGVTRTHRVEVDLGTALALQETGGEMTIETLITSDQHTERIVREKSM